MTLHSHIKKSSPNNKKYRRPNNHQHSSSHASREEYDHENLTKYTLPEKTTSAEVAYRIIHDELSLDGEPILDMASFLTTWMEPQAEKLIMENIAKNFVDQDGFPTSQTLHERCISMLANLWKVPEDEEALGTVCGGSSEGVLLGGLAMKWKWKEQRKKMNKDFSKPNVIFGSNVHCSIEKFAKYFDVEARIIPVSKESHYVMDCQEALKQCDENTIGIFSVFGSTYTGHFEQVEKLSMALDALEKEKGLNIPIHVDAASGGFIAPFVFPDTRWSFEVKRVVSINCSGHKYGLVYPGLGWVLWRSREYLVDDLIFELHYLGTTELSYTLNFSRPSSSIIAQYYNFIRLGKEGYTKIIKKCMHNAMLLSNALEESGHFEVLSDIHRPKNKKASGDNDLVDMNPSLPLVAFTLSEKTLKENPSVKVDDIADLLHCRGWLIPAYNLPKSCEKVKILRVVIKESTSSEIVERLVNDSLFAIESLIQSKSAISQVIGPFQEMCAIRADKSKKPEKREAKTYSRPC